MIFDMIIGLHGRLSMTCMCHGREIMIDVRKQRVSLYDGRDRFVRAHGPIGAGLSLVKSAVCARVKM